MIAIYHRTRRLWEQTLSFVQLQGRRKCPFLITLLTLSNESAVSTVLSSAYVGHKGWTDTVIVIMIRFQEVSVLEKHVPARRFSRTRLFTPGRILHITYVKKSATDKWVFLAHVVPSICLQISFSHYLGHTSCMNTLRSFHNHLLLLGPPLPPPFPTHCPPLSSPHPFLLLPPTLHPPCLLLHSKCGICHKPDQSSSHHQNHFLTIQLNCFNSMFEYTCFGCISSVLLCSHLCIWDSYCQVF